MLARTILFGAPRADRDQTVPSSSARPCTDVSAGSAASKLRRAIDSVRERRCKLHGIIKTPPEHLQIPPLDFINDPRDNARSGFARDRRYKLIRVTAVRGRVLQRRRARGCRKTERIRFPRRFRRKNGPRCRVSARIRPGSVAIAVATRTILSPDASLPGLLSTVPEFVSSWRLRTKAQRSAKGPDGRSTAFRSGI